jgi:predicted PurR-regulated permease PerM
VVTLALILVVLILPFALLTAALAQEVAQFYHLVQSDEVNPTRYFRGVFNALADWLTALLDRFGRVNISALQRRISAALAQGSQYLATQTLGIGAGLVWLPLALYFFVTGALWQGLALCAWGVLVIGLIDNLLRPILVGKDTRMPDYVVMITTLSGMVVFGINGFVIGPAIAAMFMAVWHIYTATRQDEQDPVSHTAA